MRRPKLSEFDDGDGNGPDFETYTERMGDYEDAERDRQIEEEWDRQDRKDKKERHADYSDQEEK